MKAALIIMMAITIYHALRALWLICLYGSFYFAVPERAKGALGISKERLPTWGV